MGISKLVAALPLFVKLKYQIKEVLMANKSKKVKNLIKKYPEFKNSLKENYGSNIISIIDNGLIYFDPESKYDIIGAENLSYNKYLKLQIKSAKHNCHSALINGLLNGFSCFTGRIESKSDDYVYFKQIEVAGYTFDGERYTDTEFNIRIEADGFEDFKPGDCVWFNADVYRYIANTEENDKVIDYGLQNVSNISKTHCYQPINYELYDRHIPELMCKICLHKNTCSKLDCKLPKAKMHQIKNEISIFAQNACEIRYAF